MKARSFNYTGRYWLWNFQGNFGQYVSAGTGSDKITPGALRKGNFRAPQPWTYSVEYRRTLMAVKRSYWTGFPRNGNLISEQIGPVPISGSYLPLPEWDRNLLYNACLSKLNEKTRGSLDLSVSIAEMMSTKRMFAATAKTLRFAGGFRGAGGSKDVANGWLQFQYGWKPLLSDVFGAADESIRIVLNKLERYSASVTLPFEEDRPASIFGLPGGHRVVKGKQSCRINLALEVPGFDLSRWTGLNPISLAWELIPYSFVVDWFVDVGSYLRNLETGLLYGLRFREGYISELYAVDLREEIRDAFRVNQSSSQWQIWSGLRPATVMSRRFERKVLLSYPLPTKPTVNTVSLGSNRLLSAAALLRQLLK